MKSLRRQIESTPHLETVYRRAVSVWPYARRLGSGFWRFYDHLQAAQFQDPATLAAAQFDALRETVAWAWARSPFYRRLWERHGLSPADLRAPADLARFPVVGREELAVAEGLGVYSRRRMLTSTSGTTGTPFQFWTDRHSASLELAAIFHQWTRAGFAPGDWRVEMRGFQTEAVRNFPDQNVLRVSTVAMERHLDVILATMERRRIPFLHGYPSALARFAALLEARGRTLAYPVRGVFLASEMVYDWQVERIERVLAPRTIVAHYGTAERVALGAWCERARTYHFMNPYGVFEQDTDGAVIGTSLIVRATPFIRYRLTDVANYVSHAPCPACGRGYTPVVGRIEGRLEDHLVTESGETVPPAVVTFPFKNLSAVRATQVVQAADRSVTLRCVFGDAPSERVRADREVLRAGMRMLLGASIPVRFEEVEEIPHTSAGKVRWIVSAAEGGHMREDGDP